MSDISEDLLGKFTADILEDTAKEEKGAHEIITELILDYASTVVEPLIRESAGLDAKYNRAVSYPEHTITAVFTGAILYIHDRISTGQPKPDAHDIRLLCTALTLHDINKFWNETTDSNHSGNYRKLIQDYFENDPFDLKVYFPSWEDEMEEIVYLVQHTQESDDAQHETTSSRPKYAKLLPYAKIGDKVASLSKLDYPLIEIHRRLNIEGHDVHILSLPEIPQQLLSQIVYKSTKQFLVKSGGIPLLISPQGILYLSSNKIEINPSELKTLIGNELGEKTDAKPDFTHRKFDLSPLLAIPLDEDTRFGIFVNAVREKMESGILKALGKTAYPQEKDLQESLACLTYFIYNDKNGSDWTQFPELEESINDGDMKSLLNEIGQIRQNYSEDEEVGGQKCKAHAAYKITDRHTDYIDTLLSLHTSLKDAILPKLKTESSALNSVIESIRAHNEEISMSAMNRTLPEGNADICFMCGAFAKREYKPGAHFLQSGGFTKRATLKDQYKRECDICQIERLLINDLVQKSGFRVTDDLMFFYFYFDSVFVNLKPFHEQMSKVKIDVQGTTTGKLALGFTLNDFETPFHIAPMAIKSKSDNSSKSTRKARAIHTAIKACLKCGCKCVATSPYTLLRTYDDVFYNERPSTLEKNLGLDRVSTFKNARLVAERLDLVNSIDGMKGLYQIQHFRPMTVIPFIKRNENTPFPIWVRKNGDRLNELFGDNKMNMEEIAKKGINLFGKQYNSSTYKRVKIFRTALDSLVSALAQKYPEPEALRFAAAEVRKDIEREQYAPKKGKDIPSECLDYVESIAEYLKEHGLWNIKKISQWGNPLTDMYEFEHILASKTNGD